VRSAAMTKPIPVPLVCAPHTRCFFNSVGDRHFQMGSKSECRNRHEKRRNARLTTQRPLSPMPVNKAGQHGKVVCLRVSAPLAVKNFDAACIATVQRG